MLRSCRITGDVHGEVIHTGSVGARICEAMQAIPVVVNAVASLQRVRGVVDREEERARLNRDILARPRCVRKKHARVDVWLKRCPHELKFHTRQNRRKNAPLPPRRISGDFLVTPLHQDQSSARFGAQQPSKTGVEPRGDPIEDEHGWRLQPALDRRQHAATHARAIAERVERHLPTLTFASHTLAKLGERQRALGRRGRRR